MFYFVVVVVTDVILTLLVLGEEREILLCAQACNIDILLIESKLPF